MNSIHQEYLDRGESVYIARVDSIKSISGRNRVQFKWWLKGDPRIAKVEISWTEGVEPKSRMIDVNRTQSGAKVMETVLENIPEGTYFFEFTAWDNSGNRSVSLGKTVGILGSRYQDMIAPRRIDKTAVFKEHVEITWATAEKDVSRTVISYRTRSGTEQTIEVLPEEMQTDLPDYEPRSRYSWTTYYLPEEGALDEFSVSTEDNFPLAEYPLDKTGWSISSNISGGTNNTVIENVIDGNPNSVWFKDAPEATPIWLIIDMKGVKSVKTVDATQRYDVRETKLEGSLDGSNWTELGIFTFSGGEKQLRTLTFTEAVTAQYLRLTITRSSNNDGRGGFWEVSVTGSD
jgi:hypothetical protein